MRLVKIAHSFPTWLPQTQTWMYSQVKELQSLGVDAHVICESTLNLDQFYVECIHSFEHEPWARRFIDRVFRKLKIRPYLYHLVRTGKQLGVSIVHSHFGNIGWADLGAVNKVGAKHVVTFYGYDVNNLPVSDPIWRVRYKALFSRVDLVLCEGSYMAAAVEKLGCPKSKVKVHHLGVDLKNIKFVPRKWSPGEPLKIFIAASFREKKGIPYAIEAVNLIARTISVELTIIGDASSDPGGKQEKEKILSALERYELIDRTRLLGYQSHRRMMEEAYDHHIFLQPSVTAASGDTEGGAPVAIIELLASGMPVISTTHCDIPEVVGPSFRQLLAPERDATALAANLQKLIDEPNSWYGLLREARSYIEAEYDQVIQAKKLVEQYTGLYYNSDR